MRSDFCLELQLSIHFVIQGISSESVVVVTGRFLVEPGAPGTFNGSICPFFNLRVFFNLSSVFSLVRIVRAQGKFEEEATKGGVGERDRVADQEVRILVLAQKLINQSEQLGPRSLDGLLNFFWRNGTPGHVAAPWLGEIATSSLSIAVDEETGICIQFSRVEGFSPLSPKRQTNPSD